MDNESLNKPPTPPASGSIPQPTSSPPVSESAGYKTSSNPVPNPSLTMEQKVWILVSHLSIFVGFALIAPLVVYLLKKDEDATIREHAKEALNFHITMAIVIAIAFVLSIILIGLPLLFFAPIYAFVCSIIAAIQAVDGKVFRYPLTLRLVN